MEIRIESDGEINIKMESIKIWSGTKGFSFESTKTKDSIHKICELLCIKRNVLHTENMHKHTTQQQPSTYDEDNGNGKDSMLTFPLYI